MNFVDFYHQTTDTIVSMAGSDTLVHVHVGMAIYIFGQLVLRTRRGSLIALQLVLAAEVGNELLDRLYFGHWRWRDTCGDFVATLFWPTAVCVASLYRRHRWNAEYKKFQEVARFLATQREQRPA